MLQFGMVEAVLRTDMSKLGASSDSCEDMFKRSLEVVTRLCLWNEFEGEHAGIINSLAALTINTTDGFESEQAVTVDQMIVATVETTGGIKSWNGNLSKP